MVNLQIFDKSLKLNISKKAMFKNFHSDAEIWLLHIYLIPHMRAEHFLSFVEVHS